VPLGQRDGSLRQYSLLSKPEQLHFLSSGSSIVLTKLSGPRYIYINKNVTVRLVLIENLRK
jgi:hypothetical protein